MERFWTGVICGGVSGVLTWFVSQSGTLGAAVALGVTVLVWLFGGAILAVFDD